VKLVERLSTPRGFATAFVVLGAALRIWRYALNSPLWWNEAFLATNFLRRGFAQLLSPLDYNQVCPPGFLWANLIVVRALGFSEPSLRLLPLLGGIAALLVFARGALQLLPGWPGAIAVALLSVAYYPIHLSAEVKPYTFDLLAAAIIFALLAPVIAGRSLIRPTLRLMAVTPLLVFGSYPSILILTPVATWLGWVAWRRGELMPRLLHGVLCLLIVMSFWGVSALCAQSQAASATRLRMNEYWSSGFPSRGGPIETLRWLVDAHWSDWVSIPVGGYWSVASTCLLVVGIVLLLRKRDLSRIAILVGPIVAAILAAWLHRYPYGVHPRLSQSLMPAVALLHGVSLAAMVHFLYERWPSPARMMRCAGCLAMLGIVPLVGDSVRPYRTPVEHESREFARRFWPRVGQGAIVHCLRWDDEVAPWESPNPDVALFLCNQAIYSPSRRSSTQAADMTRHVLFWSPRVEPSLTRLVESTSRASQVHWSIPLPGHKARGDQVDVFETRTIVGRRSQCETMIESIASQLRGTSPGAGLDRLAY
jgi:hypothetical protein